MSEHQVTNNCPGFLQDGMCHDPDGEHKTGPPDIVISPKSSRWTEAERESQLPAPPTDSAPPLPPWLGVFSPGSTFTHNGWRCAVRHVGYEGGLWMMLVEPLEQETSRSMSRSEYRRLVAQVGKKETRKLLKARRAEVVGGEPEVEDEDAGA